MIHYEQDGKPVGPVLPAEFLGLYNAGALSDETRVSHEANKPTRCSASPEAHLHATANYWLQPHITRVRGPGRGSTSTPPPAGLLLTIVGYTPPAPSA